MNVVLCEVSAGAGVCIEVVAGRLNSCGIAVTMGASTLVLEAIVVGEVIQKTMAEGRVVATRMLLKIAILQSLELAQ
jgi:hypothetical protein